MEDVKSFVLSIIGVAIVLAVGLIVLGQLNSNIASGISCNTGYDAADFNGTTTCQYYTCSNNSQTLATPYTVNSTRVNCYNVSNYGIVVNAHADATIPTAYNTTNSIASNLSGVPSWVGILLTITLAFIVLGYFYNR